MPKLSLPSPANSVGPVKKFSLKKESIKTTPKPHKTLPRNKNPTPTKTPLKPQPYILNSFWESSVIIISSNKQKMTQVFQMRRNTV